MAHKYPPDVAGDHPSEDAGLAIESRLSRPKPSDRTREPSELGDQRFGFQHGRALAFIPDE